MTEAKTPKDPKDRMAEMRRQALEAFAQGSPDDLTQFSTTALWEVARVQHRKGNRHSLARVLVELFGRVDRNDGTGVPIELQIVLPGMGVSETTQKPVPAVSDTTSDIETAVSDTESSVVAGVSETTKKRANLKDSHDEILRRVRDGELQKDIAREFGVKPQSISAIVNRAKKAGKHED